MASHVRRIPPDLASLVASTARGDREAFRDLYDQTSAKLLGVVLRIVRDRQMAEDVVQDAYLKVWQGAGSYSPEAGRPMTWLITIARNRAVDVVRRKRETSYPEQDGDAAWIDSIPEGRDRERDFMDADRLTICLDTLETTHRVCFVEAYLGGYSREELAERHDRPVNTIKTWLHRSASQLRECLGEP